MLFKNVNLENFILFKYMIYGIIISTKRNNISI